MAVNITGTIGPVRQSLLDRSKQALGDLLVRYADKIAPQQIDPTMHGLLGAGEFVGNVARDVTSKWLESAGTGFQDSANGINMVEMPNGITSLDVDPRVVDMADVATLGALGGARVAKGAAYGVARAGKEFAAAAASSAPRIVAGRGAKNADLVALAEAQKLDARIGDDLPEKAEFIRGKTGWWKGKDGEWRWEIDDSQATLAPRMTKNESIYEGTLPEALDHPALFENYPQLRDVKLHSLYIDPQQKRQGGFSPARNTIFGNAENQRRMIDLLLHEPQHAIQRAEGFATGGDPRSAEAAVLDLVRGSPDLDLNQLGLLAALADDPGRAYRHLAGEAEARAVEARALLTPEQRRARPFKRDFDVPESQQIVTKEDGGLALAADGSQTPSSLLPVAPNEVTLNIGLNTNDGAGITSDEAVEALKKLGVQVRTQEVRGSKTEPTLIATLDRPLTPDEAHGLSVALRQEAIAQRVDGAGALHGPAKEKWGDFNPEFFLDPTPQAPKARRRSKGQTVDNPQRTAFPEIYGDPVALAKQAEAWVEPEDPILRQLFGVGRADLARIADRPGNMPASLPGVTQRGAGSEAAEGVATRRNARRLVDLLAAGREHAPQLTEGMKGWYVMDPLYRKFVDELGEEAGAAAFKRHITMTGMASPGSDVLTEINRGTTADMLAAQGKFDLFERYGGMPELHRDKLPREARSLLGHPYHKTSQAVPMRRYLEGGLLQMKSPKVPTYIESALVPETGFQTSTPVGDAHWARGVGLADTRGTRTRKGEEILPGASVTNPEIKLLGPWYRDEVAAAAGLEAVPAQAIQWGLLGPQTGVESALGAPKLELLAKQIRKTALREGITPEEALRRLIRKQGQAGSIDPQLLAALAAAVGTAAAAPSLLETE